VGASLPARRLLHPRSPRCVRTLRRRTASGYASTAWYRRPGRTLDATRRQAGLSNSSPVWAITAPTLATPAPAPIAGELAWRTAIRADCGGPLGPTGRATSSASMVCTTCRPSRLPGARRPARAAPPTPRPGGHLLGRSVVVGVLRHGGFLLLFELLGDAAHQPHRRHRTGPRPQPLQEPGHPSPGLLMAWSSAMARGMARAIPLLSGG
jgi:hypothetical protein